MSNEKSLFVPKIYWPYWILFLLFIIQTGAVCFTHCLTARLALCDTLLLVIVLASKGIKCNEKAPSVLRTAGLIAFEGLIFVNFTHAIQMLVQRHDIGVHLKELYIGLTLLDIIIKAIFMCFGVLPRLYLGILSRLLLHFGATFATLFVTLLGYVKHDEGIILMADPIFTVITSTVLSVIAFPAFCRSTPFLFGDIPTDFKVDEFKTEVNAKFSNASCDHIHVYRRWPGNAFDAFLSIVYRCSMKEPNWEKKAQTDIVQIQKEIRSVLSRAGAKRVTIQPNVIDIESPCCWDACIENNCQRKSCCRHFQTNESQPFINHFPNTENNPAIT